MIEIDRDLRIEILRDKFALIKADEFSISPVLSMHQESFFNDWQSLPADEYLQGGDCFRFRRFALYYFLPQKGELLMMPSSSYYQSQKHNTYAGGVARSFAPFLQESIENPFLSHLIKCDFHQLPVEECKLSQPWLVDVHQVRIRSTIQEAGKPTPEGIHHDGEEFVCIHMIDKKNVYGGVSTVYDNQQHPLFNCTLEQPMDSMILWDPHIMHAVTPIKPASPEAEATRDVLLLGFDPCPDLRRPV